MICIPGILLLLAAPDSAESISSAPAPGITIAQLHSSFPGRAMRQVDSVEFGRIARLHGHEGRLLTGTALASAAGTKGHQAASPSHSGSRRDTLADSLLCRSADSLRERVCRDSLARLRQAQALPAKPQAPKGRAKPLASGPADSVGMDSLRIARLREINAEFDPGEEADGSAVDRERTRGYFGQFFLDLHDGNWKWDDDWAMVIYVVVGVIVVGAFILYVPKVLYDLATNGEKLPVFKEVGLRYSYSGQRWEDGGPALYRNANLFGARFTLGLDRGSLGIGVTAEGGYIDLALRGVDDPSRVFDFQGGYAVAGPMVRFGDNRPFSLNLEFLNGTSSHRSIGWISKSRMTVQACMESGALLGVHLGAVFYDLDFLDGLVLRSGNFNRDLSLVMGVEAGWAF